MTDKKAYELLNLFANDNSLAKGGKINVVISSYNKQYTPYKGSDGMNYEDLLLLQEIVRGAENFLFWLRRKDLL